METSLFPYRTCILSNHGQAKCWGSNSVGQLGNGSIINSNVPVLVENF
ncbi:hypothetical protein [Candidatus Venteria ishoeyi]